MYYVFDSKKMVDILIDNNIKNASAGIRGDLDHTEWDILKDRIPIIDNSAYVHSYWSIPVLFDTDEMKMYECYYEFTDEEFKKMIGKPHVWTREALSKYYEKAGIL